jgi:hypothetical protein
MILTRKLAREFSVSLTPAFKPVNIASCGHQPFQRLTVAEAVKTARVLLRG